ncbi:serine hydrolase [Piscinibacter sp. HJYY11]|uniref:serine hydrolase domain-containing protein n=1 Tax=Piscinibacter sp. HJYY11 TaxID=2801333 RepID=UPI00191E3C58|nr:serine hydrolase [Piscinibacter sp. HJYY11]MBL0727854.1 serine hydrolase [Piscinibacter sp. HJYY11]
MPPARHRRAAPRRLQPSRFDAVTLQEVTETDWVADLPGAHGVASAALERVFADGAHVPGLRSLVVVREGLLIGERYFHGALPSHLLPINSVTKSVSSMLVGLALSRGTLPGLDEPVHRLLPEAAEWPGAPLAGVTLRQILQGRTGMAFDVERSPELLNARDPVQRALASPRTPPPRSGWTYNDAAVSLLSPILQRAEGMSLSALAARDLFAPLGIRRFAWQRDRFDRVLAYAGLALRPRDLAKLAWMVLQQGRWQDRQVLPADWVAESTRSHGPADWRQAPMQGIGYGHLWFTGVLQGVPLVWGLGYGGQWALLAPSLKLVVATAATSPPGEKAMAQMQAVRLLVARVVMAAR